MALKQKSLFKKLAVSIALLVVMISSATALSSYAGINNDIDFKFQIVTNGKVSKYDLYEYRSTSNVNDAWKVNLKNSTESPYGTNTYTKFHLGIKNDFGINPKGSNSYAVLEKSGAHYFAAYETAGRKDVYLYGFDNAQDNHSYEVSGYWDEETGKKPD